MQEAQYEASVPTVADRVVQASLKLVLEPIFEADFEPCSYGFRPNRRAHDAMAETRFLASKSYEWVLEGDITACFDEISHSALMDLVRARVGDKRVLALVKAFLKAGILTEIGTAKESVTGTPQGGILSPLLANVALSVLDEHFAEAPGGPRSTTKQRWTRRLKPYEHGSKSASKIGSSTSFKDACTTRSATVGIPSRRRLRDPGLGIIRSRTGSGRKLRDRN